MAINCSSGILSSSSKSIKNSLNFNDREFGLFGSFNGYGRALGSITFLIIVDQINHKKIFLFFVFLKSILLILFKFINNGYILILLRGIMGFAHMPPSIYIPIWIDQFGNINYKTVLLTIRQFVIPLGKVLGYYLCIIFTENEWKKGFFIEGIYLLFICFCVYYSNEKYFDSKLKLSNKIQNNVCIFEYDEKIINKKFDYVKFYNQIKIVFSNKIFNIENIIRAIMCGVSATIHYWCADYIRNYLLVDDSIKIFYSYTIAGIFGPFGGIFIIYIINNFIGGYESKFAPFCLLFLEIFCCLFGILMSLTIDLKLFCVYLMIFFIFQSSALTIMNGLIIISNNEMKGIVFSLANIFTMLFSAGPFPYLYGFINNYYINYGKTNYAMKFIIKIKCLNVFLIGYLDYLLFFKNENNEDINNKFKEININVS